MNKGYRHSKFLPEVHFSSDVSIEVSAPPHLVYESLLNKGFDQSGVLNLLFRLKGMKLPSNLFIDQRNGSRFKTLSVTPCSSIVIGIIGQFWKMNPSFLDIQRGDFNKPFDGQVKAVWNFVLKENSENTTLLTLKTDVFCTNETAYRYFKLYWHIEEPLSRFIRTQILKSIRRTVNSNVN